MRKALVWMLAACLAAVSATAVHAEDNSVLLWPNGAPGKVGDEPADQPLLWTYPVSKEKSNGAAVVICPGGGYAIHAVDHEGTQVARWFNSFGVSAFVLKYRLGPRYRHPAPLQDVQRAIQYVRANAEEYHVVSHRIGVMGFSAGGHLASTCATHFAEPKPNSEDPLDRVSSRPDFAVLCYPVISMTEPFGHSGSKRNLLGDKPDPELARKLSSELQVSEKTPPTFLFHTAEDTGVPPENSIAFFTACRKHKVPVELHLYQFGPHGIGLAPGDPALSTWKDRLRDWMRTSGFLADVKRAAIKGKVTLNGEPLKWGQIRFTPENEHAPIAFGMVRNGNYSLNAAHGPAQGVNSVQVIHMGDVAPQPTVGDSRPLPTDGIRVDVREDGANLDLDLK